MGMDVDSALGESDVKVSGPAAELMLFLWGRRAADLTVVGKKSLLDSWFEFVPGI